MSALDDIWDELWRRRSRWVAEHLYMRRRGADPCQELSLELIRQIERLAGPDPMSRELYRGRPSCPDAHVTISEDGPSGRGPIVVMAAAEWPGVMDPWSRIDRFSGLDAMCQGEPLKWTPPPFRLDRGFDFPDEVRREREREREREWKYAQLALSPIRTEDVSDLRRRHAVGRLADICRVVAGAVAVELAASLSMRRWWEIPRQSRSGGWMGLCAVHGYVRSRHSAAAPGTCGGCDDAAECTALVRWSVTWLADVAGSLGEVLALRLQHSVDQLCSVIVQVGAALWESLGDWQKRVCLLEPERTPHALVGGTDRDERFELLELD